MWKGPLPPSPVPRCERVGVHRVQQKAISGRDIPSRPDESCTK